MFMSMTLCISDPGRARQPRPGDAAKACGAAEGQGILQHRLLTGQPAPTGWCPGSRLRHLPTT